MQKKKKKKKGLRISNFELLSVMAVKGLKFFLVLSYKKETSRIQYETLR